MPVQKWRENQLQVWLSKKQRSNIYIYYSSQNFLTTLKFPSNQIALPHARKTQPLLSTSSGGPAYCVEFRGDWKWQREAFCLTSHWGATNFCHVCVAKGTGNPLTRPSIYTIFDMLTNRFCILHRGLLYIKCSNQITDVSSMSN